MEEGRGTWARRGIVYSDGRLKGPTKNLKAQVDAPVLCLYLTGMGTIQEARGVLATAEGSLRQLMEQAMREQRYSDVAEVAGLAEGLARLLQAPGRSIQVEPQAPVASRELADADSQVLERRPAGKGRKSEYPKFIREGDKLVKIGWSKKNKSSYEHKAPRAAVNAFARHLAGNVVEGKVFVVEDLFPIPDIANGGDLPSYQAYVTLAWLRHAGVIEKKGRNGYVLRRAVQDAAAIDEIWTSTQTRR